MTNGKTGETALRVVASGLPSEGDKEVFDWLRKKGLDPLTEDNTRRSSLDLAAEAKKKGNLDNYLIIYCHKITQTPFLFPI